MQSPHNAPYCAQSIGSIQATSSETLSHTLRPPHITNAPDTPAIHRPRSALSPSPGEPPVFTPKTPFEPPETGMCPAVRFGGPRPNHPSFIILM